MRMDEEEEAAALEAEEQSMGRTGSAGARKRVAGPSRCQTTGAGARRQWPADRYRSKEELGRGRMYPSASFRTSEPKPTRHTVDHRFTF